MAAEYFNHAVEFDPNLAEAHVGLGAAYADTYANAWGGGMNNLDQAEASYTTALRLDPTSTAARGGLISVFWERGYNRQVLAMGQELARLGEPDDVDTLLARGKAYYYGGLFRPALRLLNRVIARGPQNAEALFYLSGSPLPDETELDNLIHFGSVYLDLMGEGTFAHGFTGMAHHFMGRYAAARTQYNAATRSTRRPSDTTLRWDSIFTLFFSGALYRDMGDSARAAAEWQLGLDLTLDLLETDPENARMRMYRAAFHRFLGDRNSALEDERDFLAGQTLNGPDLLYLVSGYATLGELDVAIDLLRENLLGQGRVVEGEFFLRVLAPQLVASAAFAEFQVEHEALRRRLLQQYGTSVSP